jgi:hypothetical protein
MKWLVAALVVVLCVVAACVRQVDLTPAQPDASSGSVDAAAFPLDANPNDDAVFADAAVDAF